MNHLFGACALLLFAMTGTNAFPLMRIHEKRDAASLKQLVRKNPTNVNYLCDLAADLEKKNDLTNSASFYRECIRLEPDRSSSYVRLASVYLKMERPDQADQVLRGAVSDFPRNEKVIGAMADTKYHLGDFNQALFYYNLALVLTGRTNASFLYCGMAKASRELKKYDVSDAYFRKALESKKDLWTFYEYGKLLTETGRYEHAAWAFEKARSLAFRQEKDVVDLLQEKLAGAYYDCGMDSKAKGGKQTARVYFEKILKDRGLQKTKFAEKASFWMKRL